MYWDLNKMTPVLQHAFKRQNSAVRQDDMAAECYTVAVF